VPQKAVTALDRYGYVDEVAALVAFIAGPESSFITGANLTIDAGRMPDCMVRNRSDDGWRSLAGSLHGSTGNGTLPCPG